MTQDLDGGDLRDDALNNPLRRPPMEVVHRANGTASQMSAGRPRLSWFSPLLSSHPCGTVLFKNPFTVTWWDFF